MSADLVNPTSRSPLRGTRPSGHQTIEAKAHCQNDPATPTARLPDRTIQPSTPKSGSSALSDFRPCAVSKPNRARIEGGRSSALPSVPGTTVSSRSLRSPPESDHSVWNIVTLDAHSSRKGYGYGTPDRINYKVGADHQRRGAALHTISPGAFGHEHMADRAQILLWEHQAPPQDDGRNLYLAQTHGPNCQQFAVAVACGQIIAVRLALCLQLV